MTARPEWAPEAHWDTEKGALKDTFAAHYAELTTARQAEADRIAALPKKAGDYKLEIPADLQLPEGVRREDITVDQNNPLFKSFREYAHANKITPETAQGLYGLFVQNQIAEAAVINKRVAEEAQKLGPNHAGRVAALTTALKAQIGDKHASVLTGDALWTAAQVQALEAIVAKFAGQSSASPPGNGADHNPPTPPKTLAERIWPTGFDPHPQRKAS